MSEWVYDAPTGIFRNDALSARVLGLAEERAGVRAVLDPFAAVTREDFREYGAAVTCVGALTKLSSGVSPLVLEPLVSSLAKVLPQVRGWRLLPELRAAIPTNFGRERMVAWYGIGVGPAIDEVALAECSAIPVVSALTLCALPFLHAPDCECATLAS